MNVLKRLFLFSVLALAIAWPLQPQRANRQDREPKLNPPADTDRATAAAPTQWAKRYSAYDFSAAASIQQTMDGGYIIAGYLGTYDVGPHTEDPLILKLNPEGIMEWRTLLYEKGMGGVPWASATDIFQTPDGGFVVGGSATYGGYWIARLTPSGAVAWQKHRWGSISVRCFQPTRDGGLIFVGYDLRVMKLRSDGEVEWEKRFHQEGQIEKVEAVAQTPDGGYVVVGGTQSYSEALAGLLALKLDSAGEVEWQRVYSDPGYDYRAASSVQPLADGSYIVAGEIDYYENNKLTDAFAMKLSSEGDVVWCRAYPGSSFSPYSIRTEKIRQTADGGFIMACPSALIKLDGNGDILWQRAYWSQSSYPYTYRNYFSPGAVQSTGDAGFVFAGKYLDDLAVFKTDNQGIVSGCPLLHDPGITASIPALTTIAWSPAATSVSEDDSGYQIAPYQKTVTTETVCLPYFELTISAGPGGTTKPEPATHGYAGGSSVKVYALPDERHVFSYWSGDVPERKRLENPVRIDMDDNKSIKANFARPNFLLTISAGSGGTTDPTPGVHTYAGDTVVNVTALPDANHVFLSWTGDVSDEQRGQNTAMIEMDSDKTVAANFLRRIFPPLDLRVETQENRSLFTVEHINILTWRPNPMNNGIIKYRVYELRAGNLVLLAEPAVGTETYWHRGVEKGKTYTYVVKAVGADGREGEPATVTMTVS